jgi:3',5'-cyclic AMP phosphodiesterase CpdA
LRHLHTTLEIDVRRRFRIRREEPLNIIISGDLTQSGLDNDYATVNALLYGEWPWRFAPIESRLGFAWTRGQVLTVPGNHDHWRAPLGWLNVRGPAAYTRDLAPAWFEPTPWKRVVTSRDGQLRVELFGVDSNSGLLPKDRTESHNPLARGAISAEEFAALEKQLEAVDPGVPPDASVVRAIVCHHAFSSRGATRPLDPESRQTLIRLALRHHVSAVLTGHTHEFADLDWPMIIAPGHPAKLKELRSATTLQGTRGRGRQGFWVHSITRSADNRASCQWKAVKYQWGGGTFEVDTRDPVIFSAHASQRL